MGTTAVVLGGLTMTTDQPCPQGRTDYEACFAPFRYCPVKGCGRAEGGQQLPTDATPTGGKVWCATCKCVHIAAIPAATWQCADCGWGQWEDEAALYHAHKHIGHGVYVVHHQIAPREAASA